MGLLRADGFGLPNLGNLLNELRLMLQKPGARPAYVNSPRRGCRYERRLIISIIQALRPDKANSEDVSEGQFKNGGALSASFSNASLGRRRAICEPLG